MLHSAVPRKLGRILERVAEVLPAVKAALQWAHPLNAELLQLLCHPGTCGLIGSSTVENNLLVGRQAAGPRSDIFRKHTDSTRQHSRVRDGIK